MLCVINWSWKHQDYDRLCTKKSIQTLVQSLRVFYFYFSINWWSICMKSFHTGTFFWVTTHTESFPRTPIEVIPADFTALNAYSGSFKKHHPPHEWRNNRNLTSHTCTIDSMFEFARTEYLTTYVIVQRHFVFLSSLTTQFLKWIVSAFQSAMYYVMAIGWRTIKS
jgi:hypothetical protein